MDSLEKIKEEIIFSFLSNFDKEEIAAYKSLGQTELEQIIIRDFFPLILSEYSFAIVKEANNIEGTILLVSEICRDIGVSILGTKKINWEQLSLESNLVS